MSRRGGTGLTAPRRGTVAHDQFDRLLIVLLAEFVMTGIADSAVTRMAAALLYLAVVVLAIRTTGARSFRWAPKLIALGLIALVGVGLSASAGPDERGYAAICTAIVTLGALLAVLGRVVRHERVSLQTIAGALCGYLLIGFLFASVYMAADQLGTAPLFGKPVTAPDYSYFSFVTLTTTGYGDFTAFTDLGQRFAVVEAMAGQIFLATMVARLVAMFRPARGPRSDGSVSEPDQP